MEEGSTVEYLVYDNDITLLYKWAKVFDVPTRLIVVRPRTDEDNNFPAGTETLVFESLTEMIKRLVNEKETPQDIYDIITRFSKSITSTDIIMTYYSLFKNLSYEEIDQFIQDMNLGDKSDSVVYGNQQTLDKAFDDWKREIRIEKIPDFQRWRKILDIQETLKEYDKKEKLALSPVKLSASTVSFNPKFKLKGNINVEDGIDIFNDSIVSKFIPYIRYNDMYERSYYKVYTGDKTETEPKYNITILPHDKTNKKNTIYMNLWVGEDPNTLGTHETYYMVIYYLENNHMTVETPIGLDPKSKLISDIQIAFQRVKNALPTLEFGQSKEIKVRGEFNIWNATYDEISFLDMLLSDPVMNVYLYIEEQFDPFAFKKRIDIHYRSIYTDISEGQINTEDIYNANYASVSIIMNQKYVNSNETIEISEPGSNKIYKDEIDSGTPYIQVIISRAESRALIADFSTIFRLLMMVYLDNKENINAEYIQTFPSLADLPQLLLQKKPETSKTGKRTPGRKSMKSALLEEQAPDLYIPGHVRGGCTNLPIIVNDDEAQEWLDKGHQVMEFPPEDPKWNFVCPTEEMPHPGFIENKSPSKDKYPYMPCCYKKDHMSEKSKSKYRQYIEAMKRGEKIVKKEKVAALADSKITTRKIVEPYGTGVLPVAIENIVKRYSEEHNDIVRYGVIRSPNSLLHCVCVALDDPTYFSMKNDKLKESYVAKLRHYIANNVELSLLKQELYDYSDEEIFASLNSNSFLDPALFYRALEETFKINIYVFTYTQDTDENFGMLEVPRFKLFHSRPQRVDRTTIVIMKNWGSESNALTYPQCELIVDYDDSNKEVVKAFGNEMMEQCHTALQESLKTLTWTFNPDNSLSTKANIYYYINHLELFKVPAVSQYVDGNGKMRALTLNINETLMTVMIIPSQPENLPHSDDVNIVSADFATDIFGTPVAVSRSNIDGSVNGLWYTIMDITFGEYIPIEPIDFKTFTDKYGKIGLGPENPIAVFDSTSIDNASRLTILKHTLDLQVQIIRWLYDIARLNSDITVEDFINNYVGADEDQVDDSAYYYDLSNVPRKLPDVENIDKALQIMEKFAPSMFQDGLIIMYDKIFAERIFNMLKDYDTLTYGERLTPIKYLQKYYTKEEDFSFRPFTKIFISERDLQLWLASNKLSQSFVIKLRIDINMSKSNEPYLYQDDEGKIYIIQNVNSLEIAYNVAEIWKKHMINTGKDTGPLRVKPSHLLYGISPIGKIIPLEDHTIENVPFYRILYYGTEQDRKNKVVSKYAAILEIL